MARATELLARLNPTTCRIDIGRGGVAELTNIDIAGALGMVKDRLGRAMLELLYWDAQTPGARDTLIGIVYPEIVERIREQREAMVDAELRELTAETAQEAAEARRIVDRVKSACFPADRAKILSVVWGVVIELGRPTHCPRCNGRGAFLHGELLMACTACQGRGRQSHSERARAEFCGLPWSTYCSPPVRSLHRWASVRLGNAAADAERELWAALRSDWPLTSGQKQSSSAYCAETA